MENQRMKNRYEFIDLLKALAIFFVVLYHFNNIRISLLENCDITSYLNYFSVSVLSVCVPIFFLTNGALLLNKELDLKKHIFKLINIVILVTIWSIITLLLLMPIHNEYLSLLEFTKYIWKLKLNWNDHLWFLEALVVIYIFFPLIKLAYDKEKKYLYFFLGVSFLMTFGNEFVSNGINVMAFILGYNDIGYQHNFFAEFNAFRGIYGFSFVYFILGGLFMSYKEKLTGKSWVAISLVTIVISMILLTIYGIIMTNRLNKNYDIVWNGYSTITTLCMTLAIAVLSLGYRGNNKISKLIKSIGSNSLGIYFVHRVWGSLLINFVKNNAFTQSLFVNLLFAILITLISLLTVLLLKRIPVVRKLFIM